MKAWQRALKVVAGEGSTAASFNLTNRDWRRIITVLAGDPRSRYEVLQRFARQLNDSAEVPEEEARAGSD